MAKKKAKSKSKAKSHEAKIASALGTLNNNRTPLSSILPTQNRGFFSSRDTDSKGTRGSKFSGPSKLLLAVTDPGPEPKEPKAPGPPPYTVTTVGKGKGSKNINVPKNAYKSWVGLKESPSGWNVEARSYTKDRGHFQASIDTHNKQSVDYKGDMKDYTDVKMPNFNTASAEYKKTSQKNMQLDSDYKRDLRDFFSRNIKSKVVANRGQRSTKSNRGSRRG